MGKMKKDNIHISGIVSIYHDINKYIKKNSNSCGVCDFYCYQKSHRLPAILPLSTEETLVLGTGPGGLHGRDACFLCGVKPPDEIPHAGDHYRGRVHISSRFF